MSLSKNEISAQLIADYRSGNKKALTQLVGLWHKKFCEKGYYIVKDADLAKDVAQETWRTIINKFATLKEPERFGGWAIRIVYTKAIDALRKKQKTQMAQINSELVQFESGPASDKDKVLKSNLYEAINNLPLNQQHVIRLFYLEEYSINEIAKTMNIKGGTVKSRLFHAREKLKTILKPINYEN